MFAAMAMGMAYGGDGLVGSPRLFPKAPGARTCCKCGWTGRAKYCPGCGHRMDPPKGKKPCCEEAS